MRSNLGEVASVFLRLGFTAFGGPAAHIAMFRRELVERRAWLTDAEFADLLGLTNLIPGPNSTEMAMHLGHRRAGWKGLLTAGLLFILPAALMVAALAVAYVRYGALPEVQSALAGAKPVIIAVVIHALLGLRKTVLPNVRALALALAVAVLSIVGVPELPLIFVPALLLGAHAWTESRDRTGGFLLLGTALFVSTMFALSQLLAHLAGGAIPYSLGALTLAFLKVGALLYGSGYVLLSYLDTDLVHRFGWLSGQRLLDATTVGQFTPGPVFTTATFVGYLVGGPAGAVAATVAIFLPSFVFVALSAKALPRLRSSPVTASFLDAVNAASLGLMAAVVVRLGRDAFTHPVFWALGAIALLVLLKTKVNSAWLVLAGALVGLLVKG